jgi:superfamily II DNA or RNA helicase
MSTGLLSKPELGPCTINLWDYQERAVESARNEFLYGEDAQGRRIRSTLIVIPTGGGKTIVFGSIARRSIERGGRVLILAHTDELCKQAIQKMDFLGVEAGLEKAGARARSLYDPDAVVACVPTLKPRRLKEWPRDYFDIIITDEAHHAVAGSYMQIYGHFSKALHVGVTATPLRADDESLYQVFQSVAYQASMIDLMTAPDPGPYLSRIKFLSQDIGIDLKGLRKQKNGDFSPQLMEQRIAPHVSKLANWFHERWEGRPFVIFTPGVGSAQGVATALQSGFGIKADWVSGDDPDREIKIKRMEAGELDGLVNSNLLREGFDCPRIACVGIFHVTSSVGLLAQEIGRGTRRGKPDCLILDPGLQAQLMHEAISPAELMGADWIDPETIELASAELRNSQGKPVDLLEAIERAQVKKKELDVVRIRAREQRVGGRAMLYDPLAAHETLGLAFGGVKDRQGSGATERQLELLAKFKVDGHGMSRIKAKTTLDYLFNRVKNGKATLPMVGLMISKGVDPTAAREMSFEEARSTLDRLCGKRRA